jgi:predicted Rossmann-fold nucleotide-binding protein
MARGKKKRLGPGADIEIESIDDLDRHLASRGTLDGVVVQGLDLRLRTEVLRGCAGGRAVFLGCRMDEAAEVALREGGALIFPPLDGLPYAPYRPALYTADELLEGTDLDDETTFFRDSVDARIYAHYQRGGGILEELARRVHDHAVEDALGDLLDNGGDPHRVVAIMGGHAVERTDATYRKVAQLGRALARRGYLVATGGGPGAMEAANLGAWLAPAEDAALDDALTTLAVAPTFRDPGWLKSALEVREATSEGALSVGIPTWFYGHEPSNLFATQIAKFFSNSLREDGLLAIATHGVVFAPGSAGTVQEVFIDAAQNHYGTFDDVSPMVFLDRAFWSERIPVKAVLEPLSGTRQYAERILLADTVEETVEAIAAHPPVPYAG